MTAVPVMVAALAVEPDDLPLPFQELVPLVDQLSFTLASGATVNISAFVEGVRANDGQMVLTLDGDVVLLDGGDISEWPSYTRSLPAGTHTVDCVGFAFGSNVTVGHRGVIVTDLTTGMPDE